MVMLPRTTQYGTVNKAGPEHTELISHLEDLDRLRRLHRRPPGRIAVRIALHGLDDSRRSNLDHRLERHINACGCNEGSVAGLLYLVGIPTLIFIGLLVPHSIFGWIAVGGGLVVALLAGKIFGLVVARLRFFRALNEIDRTFSHRAQGL